MGLELDCPLCCSETFSCHNSLKYHLLSVIDNLLCPACQKRFDSVIELAMHLGRLCMDDLPSPQLKTNSTDLHQETCGDIQTETDIEFVACNRLAEKTNLEFVTNNARLSSKTSLHVDVGCGPEESVNEDQYYCSTCNVHLSSIEEHIETFHSGEEILLSEEKIDSQPASPSIRTDETEVSKEDETVPDTSNPIKSARLLDTVQVDNCVDKDGRLYVRKVVKIEKFWDDSGENSNIDTMKLPFPLNQKLMTSQEDPQKVVEVYECSKCEMKFMTVKQYCQHTCYGKYKTCHMCDAHFISLKFLRAHIKLHNRQRTQKAAKGPSPPFVCEICNTNFAASKSLQLHKRMHDPIITKAIDPPFVYGKEGEELPESSLPRKMFVCQICKKSYDKQYEEAHNQFHSNDSDFTCEICNRKFFTKENLEMHMNGHNDPKKYLCPNCKKAFLSEEKLQAHKPTECQTRQYECQYCGRRFTRPHEKVKHERIHTGEKPHICEICGKAFRVSYCLTLHMRTHSGSRPYHCDICGKRFKAHSVYSHHLLTHSNDRKFKCPFCPKMFKTGVQLAGHKNSHTKPFNCTECNRPFGSLYATRAHMEAHQRENNLKYNCWLCGASYARAFALRDHFKEQHINEIGEDVDINALMQEHDNFKVETIKMQDDD